MGDLRYEMVQNVSCPQIWMKVYWICAGEIDLFCLYSPVDHTPFQIHIGSIQSGGIVFARKAYLQIHAFGVTRFQHKIPR